MTETEENKLYIEFKEECKAKHYRCSNTCDTYNTEDRDCEIYGDSHPPYSHCQEAFETWLERKEK